MNNKVFDSNFLLKKYKEIFEYSEYCGDFKSFLKENSFEIIVDSEMFDEKYYSEMYPDAVESNLNLIEHYLRYGVYENCNPNPFFNTCDYVNRFESDCNGLNPFVHYLLFYFNNDFSESSHIINENNISTENFCVFLIDNNFELTKKTLNSIKSINKNIPVYLISSNNNSYKLNKYVKRGVDDIKWINELVNYANENFITILYSGDLITKDFVNFISSFDLQSDSNIGAIVFDSNNYYSINDICNFKPNFSPDLYLEYDYIQNSVVLNKFAVLSVDGFDINLNYNYMRDLIFRLYESEYSILKEDLIGFKLNSIAGEHTLDDGVFLEKYIARNELNSKLQTVGSKLMYNTNYKKVSIIIPFKDQPGVTENCILSILKNTEYSNYEIILINNNSYESKTFEFIDKYNNHEKIVIINYSDEFNYSKVNNFATQFASGDVFVFLNNDTEVISKNWLTLLVGDAIQKNIGVVGAKLFYPNGSIQHIGVVIGLNGLAGHLFNGEFEKNIPWQFNKYKRNVSAVTGACMAISREVFESIGGFDELFEVTGSDVEICIRLMQRGYRNIINPNIQLIHHERKTRSKINVREIDIKLSMEYYKPYLENGDPFFNKHFSLNSNKLILKDKNEVPLFKLFLNKFIKEELDKSSTLNTIIESEKESHHILFDKEVLDFDVSHKELDENAILMNNFFKNNSNLELNTVIWFIPWFEHIFRGGIYTIFRIANYFSISENSYNIFVFQGKKERTIDEIHNEIIRTFPNLKFELIELDSFKDISELPESDIGICTYWTTAYSLVRYNNCKAKFYLNQDFEPLFAAAGSVYGLIEQTYRFNFIGLANSKGVYEKYLSYGNLVKYFTPSIDKDVYYPIDAKNSKKRIVFYGRPNNPRNGFILGIEALKIIKAYFGDSVEIFSVGADFDLDEYGLTGIITNLGLVDSIESVADLYRKCDIGLVFMFTPHPSYQPLEYMACGCATISNINENNGWLLKNKVNAILSEPTISCVVENIINLLNDDNLRNSIIYNGFKTIENLDWDIELYNIVEFIKNPLK